MSSHHTTTILGRHLSAAIDQLVEATEEVHHDSIERIKIEQAIRLIEEVEEPYESKMSAPPRS